MGWSDQERHSFVWDGWNIVLERIDVGGSTAHVIEYYWGEDFSGTEQGAGGVGGLLAVSYDGEFYVPIYGGNGNIMGYVDESGAFAAKFVYDPYGDVVSIEGDMPLPLKDSPPVDISGLHGSDFSFGFSTKYHDREVGLVAYQLRSYSPVLGRWLNRDPIEEEGGVNLYGFVDNGPVFTADSMGSAKFKGKSKTSGFFYSFSVDKCEVVIIYGHGHIRLPHEVIFVDKKTSAAYFWGCWPDVTNSKIPRENRLEESVGPHKEYYDDQVFDRLKTLRPIALLRAKKICESGCCKGGVWVRFLFSPSDSWETSILDSAKGYSSYNKRKKLFGGGVWEGDTHVQCDK
jgi:RHS repeat-associated protein